MTADQRPGYTPRPVTQRDGSALANSNCRMASIATGLDYETRGGKTSTGAKMRTYTSDQSGGTDSADAAQAWANGYDESLSIRDGYTFDNALQDLAKGHLVHLDVWHAATGGPCLSGSGAYGHTIAVLPDCSGGSWLVADPWCNPPKWSRVAESKLRAGAEEWGRRVYGAAVNEADWDTDGDSGDRADVASKRASIVRRVARDLMTRYHAGGPEDPTPDPGDTGGAQAILFTRTIAIPLEGDDVTTRVTVIPTTYGKVTSSGPVDCWTLDGVKRTETLAAFPADVAEYSISQSNNAAPKGGPFRRLAAKPLAGYYVASSVVSFVPDEPPPVTDCDQAVAERDQEWAAWVLDGSPWGT